MPELKRGDPNGLVFDMTVATLHQLFVQGARDAGVLPLMPVPYHLRHTGVSAEMLAGERSLKEAKRRGRWTADSSFRRYSKGGRIAEQMAKLPVAIQEHCFACHAKIGEILAGRQPPCTPGAVTGSPSHRSR